MNFVISEILLRSLLQLNCRIFNDGTVGWTLGSGVDGYDEGGDGVEMMQLVVVMKVDLETQLWCIPSHSTDLLVSTMLMPPPT